MNDFLMLERDVIPCWYEIGFDPENVALVLRVHEEFVSRLPKISESWKTSHIIESFGFKDFNLEFNHQDFGFERIYRYCGTENAFMTYSAAVPELEIFKMKTCSGCQGHLKDLFGDECLICNGTRKEKVLKVCRFCNGEDGDFLGRQDCSHCKGKGKEPDSHFEWRPFHAIAATNVIFFSAMFFGTDKDKLTSSPAPQLISITSGLTREPPGAPLGGVYSIPLVQWFLGSTPGHVAEVEQAMIKTITKIHGKFDAYDKMNTWAEIRDKGWVSISCPGDRTGLFPEHGSMRDNHGYRFYDHNLDNAWQQLILLAALGALSDKARKELGQ